jgi:hypothetical protein
MSYYIYSPEALPNPEMIGKPRYTPDNDYITWGGIALPPVPKDKWVKLEDYFSTSHHDHWKDKQGRQAEIPVRRFKSVVDNPERGFAGRGVVVLDHEPSVVEKEAIEKKAREINLRFRKRYIEFFESQRKAAEARQGTYEPNPYTDECYDMLQMNKPYSIEALMALRDPGKEAAREMAEAIRDVMRDERKHAAESVADLLTAPKQNASTSDNRTPQKPAH